MCYVSIVEKMRAKTMTKCQNKKINEMRHVMAKNTHRV